MTERIISTTEYEQAEQVKRRFLELPPDARQTFLDLLQGGVLLNRLICSNVQQTTKSG